MDSQSHARAVPMTERVAGRIVLAGAGVLRESVRRHRVLCGVILVYALACFAAGRISGGSVVVDIDFQAGAFALAIAAFAAIVVVASAVRVAATRRERPFLPAVLGDIARQKLPTDRLANLLVPLLLSPLFFSTFSSFKRLIPYIAPFSWDETFMRWDRWLHGTDAWVLLHSILGTPIVTSAIALVYNKAWLLLMFAVFLWQAASLKRPELRRQFLTSFVLYWVLIGTISALLLSSAGPCYFGRVTGMADPYQPLLDYLRSAAEQFPVWGASMQEVLWENHRSAGTMLGGGISAMPSMHVAIAVLLALLGWRINRWAGIGFTLYAVVILLGSVHLGWHYAIDGYLSIVLGIGIWFGVGWVQRQPTRAARHTPSTMTTR